MTVFERIEFLRKSKKISQGKLEKELGFSNGSISKWRISMPTSERLQKIADYFGVTIDYLITGNQSEEETVNEENYNREIGEDLDRILKKIENDQNGPFFYNNKPIDDESLLWLRDVLKLGLNRLQEKKDTSKKNK